MVAQPSATVYLASFAALMGAVSMGLSLGYTAPAFLDMEKNSSTILSPDKDTRDSEKGLIGSMLAVGALVGGFLVEPCNNILGRRLSMIIYGGPFICGWLLIGLASSVPMIIWGRILTGLCCGLVSGTAPTYVVEISPPSIRGLLGTCFQVMVVIGILIPAVFGLYMSWKALALFSITASIVTSILMFFMPETPQWLLSKGKSEEAEMSLKKLRINSINEEFNSMTVAANAAQNSNSNQYALQTFKSKEFYKPFAMAIGLMFFQQFSGINAILFYQGDIFKKASPSLDAALATIIVCIAQVIATIIGSLLVDKLGRKILLLVSGSGHTVALLVFGLYSHVSDPQIKSQFSWVPLTSVIIFISSFSIGFGPIPWMMIPELSSAKVRSMIASISTAFNWTCVFIVTLTVKPLINGFGEAKTYWMFAFFCILSCVFSMFGLPETKGKSAEQIQREILGQEEQQQQLNDNSARSA